MKVNTNNKFICIKCFDNKMLFWDSVNQKCVKECSSDMSIDAYGTKCVKKCVNNEYLDVYGT